MMLRAEAGAFELYDISNNQLTGTAVGAIGVNLRVSGIGDLKGAGKSEMVLRNARTGDFWLYDYNANTTASREPWSVP
jgi:hypothetical protein